MRDLLLPTTDAGVVAQAVVALVVIGVVLAATWRRGDWRLFGIGLALVTMAFFGLRAVH